MSIWDLHGPSKFISNIEEGLRANRAGVVIFPMHRPVGFSASIVERLGRQGWFLNPLDWIEGEYPLNFLFQQLAVPIEPNERQSVALLCDRLGSILIVVDDIQQRDWPEWKRFLMEYELELRRRGNERVPLLLCVLCGVEKEMAVIHAPAISVYPWAGVVTELDTHIFIRSQSLNIDRPTIEKDISSRIIAKLSLWDIDLAAKLLKVDIKDLTSPHITLRELASERKWVRGDSCCWSMGTEDSFEGRTARHSLWLAVNDGGDELEFRVWSAQASVGLLLVEQRRREIAPRAARYLRLPVEVEGEWVSNVQDLEIGQLAHLLILKRCPDMDLMRRVKLLKRVRNALAHVKVVEPALLFDTDLLG